MFDYARQLAESVLGKTVLGLVAIFVLGAAAMAALPKVVVSPETMSKAIAEATTEQTRATTDARKEISEARSTIAQVQNSQQVSQRALEAQVVSLRIDLLKEQRRALQRAQSLSPREKVELQEISENIRELQDRKAILER